MRPDLSSLNSICRRQTLDCQNGAQAVRAANSIEAHQCQWGPSSSAEWQSCMPGTRLNARLMLHAAKVATLTCNMHASIAGRQATQRPVLSRTVPSRSFCSTSKLVVKVPPKHRKRHSASCSTWTFCRPRLSSSTTFLLVILCTRHQT